MNNAVLEYVFPVLLIPFLLRRLWCLWLLGVLPHRFGVCQGQPWPQGSLLNRFLGSKEWWWGRGIGKGLNPLEGTQTSLFIPFFARSSLRVSFFPDSGAWVRVECQGPFPLGTHFLTSFASVSLLYASTRSYITTCCSLKIKLFFMLKGLLFLSPHCFCSMLVRLSKLISCDIYRIPA